MCPSVERRSIRGRAEKAAEEKAKSKENGQEKAEGKKQRAER
jgi:hypothetical protein